MKATINSFKEEQAVSFENTGEKSELMQVFESLVHDTEWAYKDLLKAIFEIDN